MNDRLLPRIPGIVGALLFIAVLAMAGCFVASQLAPRCGVDGSFRCRPQSPASDVRRLACLQRSALASDLPCSRRAPSPLGWVFIGTVLCFQRRYAMRSEMRSGR